MSTRDIWGFTRVHGLTCLEELDSDLTGFRGVAVSSPLLTTSLCLSASGVEGFVVSFVESAAPFSSALGGVVLTLFRDGPIK